MCVVWIGPQDPDPIVLLVDETTDTWKELACALGKFVLGGGANSVSSDCVFTWCVSLSALKQTIVKKPGEWLMFTFSGQLVSSMFSGATR